ncbi:Phospholipid-binding protein, PBP family (fragment) [Imperialibacter sp. EC-SDR9]
MVGMEYPLMHHIMENTVPGTEGMNDFMKTAYGGPCPPSGTHRYFFLRFML